jgi:hypothetical protein
MPPKKQSPEQLEEIFNLWKSETADDGQYKSLLDLNKELAKLKDTGKDKDCGTDMLTDIISNWQPVLDALTVVVDKFKAQRKQKNQSKSQLSDSLQITSNVL